MNVIKQKIKAIWEALTEIYGSKDDINSDEDYARVEKINKRIKRIYLSRAIIFPTFAVIVVIIAMNFASAEVPIPFILKVGMTIFAAFMGAYVSLAFASMKIHKKQVKKSVFKAAITGYKIGRQYETTHYTVSHEFNDTYKVTSHTDNDGCLYAAIFAGLNYIIWAAFCSYLAPILSLKKYKANVQEMQDWKEKGQIAQ